MTADSECSGGSVMLAPLRAVIVCSIVTLFQIASTAHAQWIADGVPVCTDASSQIFMVTVPDGSGGTIVVWEDNRGGIAHVYAQRIDATGAPRWATNGVLVSSAAFDAGEPVATADAYGGVIVVYVQDRQYVGGLVQSDLFAQRLNSLGVQQWGAGGVGVCQADNVQLYPKIVSDFRDPSAPPGPGAIVTWADHRGASDGDIYAQAIASDGTMRYATNGLPVCTDAARQASPIIVTDGSGIGGGPKGCIIVWADSRSGNGNDDLYAQRLSPAGTPQWGSNGAPVCTDPSHLSGHTATYIGSGTAIVSWVDRRNVVEDLYAQRIGTAPWVANGVPVSAAPDGQGTPMMVADGTGGVIVGWPDGRPGNQFDVYAQRMDGAGSARWATDGIPLCVAVRNQGPPIMVSDGARGAIMAWEDTRTSPSNLPQDRRTDVYAQHVDSAGVARWGTSGFPVCTSTGNQIHVQVVSDAAGGAIATWLDTRNGNTDIYTQRITAGAGAVDVGPIAAASRSIEVYPNPVRADLTIRFGLAVARSVTAQVLSVDGRLVQTLADGRSFPAGDGELRWDLRDSAGKRVPIGVYFVRVEAGAESGTRRILVVE